MGRHLGAGLSDLRYEFQSAINAGLFNPKAVNIPFACPTGNCTFDEAYHTVAFCSSCIDAAHNLTRYCEPSNYTMQYINDTTSKVQNTTYSTWQCNTTLIGGPSVISNDRDVEYLKMEAQNGIYSIVAANLSNAYFGNCSTTAENATWSCKKQGAAVCSLYPCIRSYRAAVDAGKLAETFLSSTTEREYHSNYMAAVTLDVRCLSPDERNSLIKLGYTINETTDWLGYSGSGKYKNISSSNSNITISPNCTYAFSATSLMSVDNFMLTFLNGTITNNAQSYNYITKGSVQMQKFFNYGNISFEYINRTFSDIADSMTAYLRQDAKPNARALPGDDVTRPATGSVFRVETCISVRWAYLAFPAALVLLTLAFFVAVLVETTHQRSRLDWKSSSLALLFHGLDPETGDALRAPPETSSEMKRAAERIKVRFKRTDRGWGFSQTN
jgi:hypothetical protein